MESKTYSVVNLIDPSGVRARLASRSLSPESASHLYDFGKFVLQESRERSAYLDSKLGNYLTWASAILGILLLNQSLGTSAVFRIIGLIPALFAMASLSCCFWGLRSRLVPAPSECDWFGRNETPNAETIKRAYISVMHLCHREQQKHNIAKSLMIWRGERLLLVAAMLTGLIVIVRALLAIRVLVFP